MSPTDPDKLRKAIEYFDRSTDSEGYTSAILAAARAHLETLPRTKHVECWEVRYRTPGPNQTLVYVLNTEAEALAWVDKWLRPLSAFHCIELRKSTHLVPA